MSRCTSHSGRRRRSQHTKGIYITYVVWDTTHVRWIDKASFWKVTSAVSAQEHSTLNATAERIRISYIGWQSYSARRKLFTESIRQCRMCQHQTTREWRYLGNSNLNLPRKIHDIRKQKYKAYSSTPVEGNLMPVTQNSYDRSSITMHVVKSRNQAVATELYTTHAKGDLMPAVRSNIQAVATEYYTMPVKEYPQRVVLWWIGHYARTISTMRVV